MSNQTPKPPKSIIDELLGESEGEAPRPKKFAARLPELNPETFNRQNLTPELGGLFSYAQEQEAKAHQLQNAHLEKAQFNRESKALGDQVQKVRQCLDFYDRMSQEKQFKFRQSDAEEMLFIRTCCDRTDAILFSEKMSGQMYPTLKSVTDEWVKKVLNVPEEINFKLNTPVFVYELADLREISTKVPIFKAFEHNRVFTGVYRDSWAALDEKEKIRQIKTLVRLVGQRVSRVRLVDSDGNLLAECKSRRIELH